MLVMILFTACTSVDISFQVYDPSHNTSTSVNMLGSCSVYWMISFGSLLSTNPLIAEAFESEGYLSIHCWHVRIWRVLCPSVTDVFEKGEFCCYIFIFQLLKLWLEWSHTQMYMWFIVTSPCALGEVNTWWLYYSTQKYLCTVLLLLSTWTGIAYDRVYS